MTHQDFSGLPISAADAAVAAGYDAYVGEFLSSGSSLRNLFAVAEAAPDCALVNAHAAALNLAFEGAEGWTNAAPYLERMRAVAPARLTERERLFIAAVDAWAARDFFRALAALDELTVRWPADLCAIKWGQYHAFNLGDFGALLRLGKRAEIAHENRPYVHGMIAFALEQTHQLSAAEDEGLKASEIALDDAWAHHAVAHVMETQGRARDGARWMAHCAHTWERKGVFIRDHNWWHAALFELSLGHMDKALQIFDARLWGAWPEFPQEQIGAISMLWRLEMRGVDVGARWAPIVEQARQRAGEHIFAFHDIHYLHALARAGAPGEAEAFLVSIERHADDQAGPARAVWCDTLVPLARGTLALAREDFAAGADCLHAATHSLSRIGGSHAQRHVFAEALTCAEARRPNALATTGYGTAGRAMFKG